MAGAAIFGSEGRDSFYSITLTDCASIQMAVHGSSQAAMEKGAMLPWRP
jgi:hypothetical protein